MNQNLRALLFLAFFCCLCGCSDPVKFKITDEFSSHVATFESNFNVKVTVSIGLTDNLPADTFGLCKTWGPNNAKNIVYINSEWWKNADQPAREELVLHELGHCVIGLQHTEGIAPLNTYPNAPKSIMYPMPFGEFDVYSNNKAHYFEELRAQKKATGRKFSFNSPENGKLIEMPAGDNFLLVP